jgi:hypothetical protein
MIAEDQGKYRHVALEAPRLKIRRDDCATPHGSRPFVALGLSASVYSLYFHMDGLTIRHAALTSFDCFRHIHVVRT